MEEAVQTQETLASTQTQETSASAQTQGGGAGQDAWSEAWDGDAPETSSASDAELEKAFTDTPVEDKTQTDDKGQDGKTEDQRFTLKHLGSTRDVGLDELITLSQKGLDYDRVRNELTEYKTGRVRSEKEHELFLKELADKDGLSVEGFIDRIRAGILTKRDGVNGDRALERVKYQRQIQKLQEKAAGKSQQQQQKDESARRQSFMSFAKQHPELTPDKIQALPKDVWQRMAGGMSLQDSYAVHEAKGLRDENKRLKDAFVVKQQHQKNKARSTGSRESTGNGTARDDWDRFWDET